MLSYTEELKQNLSEKFSTIKSTVDNLKKTNATPERIKNYISVNSAIAFSALSSLRHIKQGLPFVESNISIMGINLEPQEDTLDDSISVIEEFHNNIIGLA